MAVVATRQRAKPGSLASRRALVVFAVIACIQICVPAFVLLTGDQPARFGWQMFAARASAPEVQIVDGEGTARDVDLPPLPRRRPELDYSRVLPGYVCDRHAEAKAVIVTQETPRRYWRASC